MGSSVALPIKCVCTPFLSAIYIQITYLLNLGASQLRYRNPTLARFAARASKIYVLTHLDNAFVDHSPLDGNHD